MKQQTQTHLESGISQSPAFLSIRTLSKWEGWDKGGGAKCLGSSQSVSFSRWCHQHGGIPTPLKSGPPYLVTPVGLL